MGRKNKRRRNQLELADGRTIHPHNKYSENPPDFSLLASLYPSFQAYVSYSNNGRPTIDWTDFNATRELTRVLLLHDFSVQWWIPDGQLCPTVPNRSNYIHWIEDLLASEIIPKTDTSRDFVRGFDIGTGANCIYPLLGASLLSWKFVGSDVTDVAIEWAEKNVWNNPNISALIEIRKVEVSAAVPSKGPSNETYNPNYEVSHSNGVEEESKSGALTVERTYVGPPVLCGVVRDGENFDFCMCNPPFFESMEEAGLNPKTSCGGTPAEMVCPGGENAFITRIIEDSVQLKHTFRWYTSMVGRKANLKSLGAKLREVGVTIVKTTEFVQGQTCRWGIAWSFVPPLRKIITAQVASEKRNLSFMLEGLRRQISAMDVLKSIESFFLESRAFCKLNVHSFSIDITVSSDHLNEILMNEGIVEKTSSSEHLHRSNEESDPLQCQSKYLCFCLSVMVRPEFWPILIGLPANSRHTADKSRTCAEGKPGLRIFLTCDPMFGGSSEAKVWQREDFLMIFHGIICSAFREKVETSIYNVYRHVVTSCHRQSRRASVVPYDRDDVRM